MPSAKVLESKKAAVANLVEELKGAAAGVIVDYRGLTVEEDTELRTKFRAAGVKYTVVKNSLLGFAAKEVGLEGLDEVLHGPTALAYHTEDMVAPAKVFSDFVKTHDIVSFKSGFMEGKVISLDEVKTLASTPSKEVLIAKIMGSLQSPVSGLVRLLNTIVEGGVEIADLVAKKNGGAEEVAAPAVEEAAPAEEAPVVEAPATEAPAADAE